MLKTIPDKILSRNYLNGLNDPRILYFTCNIPATKQAPSAKSTRDYKSVYLAWTVAAMENFAQSHLRSFSLRTVEENWKAFQNVGES